MPAMVKVNGEQSENESQNFEYKKMKNQKPGIQDSSEGKDNQLVHVFCIQILLNSFALKGIR